MDGPSKDAAAAIANTNVLVMSFSLSFALEEGRGTEAPRWPGSHARRSSPGALRIQLYYDESL
jgi:hypothetical protein